MEQGLAQLSTIPHVGGAFVCDNRGDVIVSSSPAVLATGTMSTMGREVGRIFSALREGGRSVSRLEFGYTTWRLLTVDIEGALLFVVCQAPADMSFVRMNVDIVLTGWRGDAQVQKRLRRHREGSAEPVNTAATVRARQDSWRVLRVNGH